MQLNGPAHKVHNLLSGSARKLNGHTDLPVAHRYACLRCILRDRLHGQLAEHLLAVILHRHLDLRRLVVAARIRGY